MKAAVYTKYGPPEALQVTEVIKPIPKDDEVLVKIHAASVNNWDWDLVRGKPYPRGQRIPVDSSAKHETIT